MYREGVQVPSGCANGTSRLLPGNKPVVGSGIGAARLRSGMAGWNWGSGNRILLYGLVALWHNDATVFSRHPLCYARVCSILKEHKITMSSINAVRSEKAPAAIGPYSQAVKVNGMVYTSGVIPLDPESGEIVGDDINAQAERVLKSLSALLEDAGASMSSVVKTTCFLQDLNDFAAFNEMYASYFTGETTPARSTVQVAGLPKGALVEVEAVAVVK